MGTWGTALVALGIVGVIAAPGALAQSDAALDRPVPRAECGPGSRPETGLQGQVPLADRQSGRSQKGYWCNLQLEGQSQNQGASWMFDSYDHCAYYDTNSYSGFGTAVIDAADPTRPRLTTQLQSPAMLGAWESLKVNQQRGLLAGTAAYSPAGNGPLFFDVYDVKSDCAQPKMLSSTPLPPLTGHEGAWAPDGNTYYATGITAIDVKDPAHPSVITTFESTHGLSISDDGNRAYTTGPSCKPNGMRIVDVSQIQARAASPQVRDLGEVCWDDGALAQASIPITVHGRPLLLFFDEGGAGAPSGVSGQGANTCCAGAARLIDISDELHPRVVSKLKLEIHIRSHADVADAETAHNGFFGYQAHYCSVDRRNDATTAACGYFQSGIRVFDIRDPEHPREIAYYNPPAQVGKEAQLRGSEHVANYTVNGLVNSPTPDLTADWCSAQVRLVPETGQLWTSCQDNGFLALKFTNDVWPFRQSTVPAPVGLPQPATCVRAKSVSFRIKSRLRRRARSATVYVNGRRLKRLSRSALRRRVRVTLPPGHSILRVVVRTGTGRRLAQTRDYTRC